MDTIGALRRVFEDLKQRRVYRVAVWYLGIAWLVVQFGNDVLVRVGAPDRLVSAIVVLTIAGFPVALALAWAFQLNLEPGRAAGPEATTSARAKCSALLVGTSLSLAVGIALWPQPGAGGEPHPPEADPAAIAVLYPQDVVGGEDVQVFADGLTRRLIDGLGAVEGLRVVSPHGVRPFRGLSVPPDSIARLLDVGTLVEPSVERVGDSIVVVVRMVEGRTGALLSSYSITRETAARLDILDEVATTLSERLRVDLGPSVMLRRSVVETASVEAWDMLQRATSRLEEFEALAARQDVRAALRALSDADSLLDEASRLDPDWIEPVATRSVIADRQAVLALPRDRTQAFNWLDRGLAHAERALAIDARDARGLYARGLMRLRMVQYGHAPEGWTESMLLDAAEADFRASEGHHRRRAQVLVGLSQVLELRGELVEALVHAERAYQLDAYLEVADHLANRLFSLSFQLDRDDDALRWCEEGRARFPTRWEFLDCRLTLMAWSDRLEADPAAAHAVADSALALYPPPFRAHLVPRFVALRAAVLARAGQRGEAVRLLAGVEAGAPGVWPPMMAAAWYRAGHADTAAVLLRDFVASVPAAASTLRSERIVRDLVELVGRADVDDAPAPTR